MATATERLFRYLLNPSESQQFSTASALQAAPPPQDLGKSDVLSTLESPGKTSDPSPERTGIFIEEGGGDGDEGGFGAEFGESPFGDFFGDSRRHGQLPVATRDGENLELSPTLPSTTTTSGTIGTDPTSGGSSGGSNTNQIMEWIGVGTDVLGSYLDYKAQKAQAQAYEDEREEIREQAAQIASPGNFLSVFQSLLPSFRTAVEATQGATIRNAVANQIARVSGLQDTGFAAALNSLAPAANDATAIAQALQAAEGVVNNQLAGLGLEVQSLPELPVVVPNFGDEIIRLGDSFAQLFGSGNNAPSDTGRPTEFQDFDGGTDTDDRDVTG
jgi:hypothetical protein